MIRSLAILLVLALPLAAQLRVHESVVDETPTAVTIQLSVTAPMFPEMKVARWLAGERRMKRPNGDLAVIRRVAIRIPSPVAHVSSVVTGRRQYALSFDPSNKPHAIEHGSFGPDQARLVDIAPSGEWFSGTIEIVVAEYSPDKGILTVFDNVSVRIAHDRWREARRASSIVSPGTFSEPSGGTFRLKRSTRSRSRFASGEWYAFEIQQTGMYKCTRSWFLNAGISASDLRNVGMLRMFGNDGTPVPESITAPRPQGPAEISRLVVDNDGDGELDDDDFVLFYGRSVRDWTYITSQKRYAHTMNPYAEKNVYFFTFDADSAGRSMDTVQSQAQAGAIVPNVLGRIAVDEDKVNFFSSGRRWVGTAFDETSPTAVFVNALPGIVAGEAVTYRAVFFSRSATVDTFRVYEHDQPMASPVLMFTSDVTSVDQIFNYAYESPVSTFTFSGQVPENRSLLKIAFGTRNPAAKGWLDWFEIFYRRSLEAVNDRLIFPEPDTSAVLEYTVRNLSSRDTRVFDVTDHSNVREVTGVEFSTVDPSICTFRLTATAGSPGEIAVVGENGFLGPPEPRHIAPADLRGYALPVSFIIISPKEFIDQADRLKQHRESNDGIQTLVANIDDIYDEFGGGLHDPFAIRDFLAYARSAYNGTLRYVLFFGNGHYDFRNISTSVRNWVVPYETAESNFQINSYASDDYFVLLDPGNPRISLAIGRLPARSLSDIEDMVDKIIRYDTQSPLDSWRNRITFVADDGQTSTNPFEGSLHTSQAENLATGHTPDTFEKRKIYTVEYPTIIGASGRRKPAANKAIVNAFNEGSLIINFTGHGNPRLWTHEAIFTREADLPQLRNRDRLTMLVAATCNYAQWDDPNEVSSGELLMTNPDGGTIAVVTATRSVYSFDNAELNYKLYDNLFTEDSLGAPVRVGDAFWAMKQVRYGPNDQKYHLLGDPTVRLVRPRGLVMIDSINGIATADSVVPVPTLGVVSVAGSVRKSDSTVFTSFGGTGLMELFDSKRTVTVSEWGGFSYEKTGSVLYRGEISVSSGMFSARLPVPKDVTFGSRARLSLYAIGSSTDAVGTTERVIISGTDTSAAIDTTGPMVVVKLQSQDFRSGDVVPPDPSLIVELSDQNGINTSTIGIGHRLEAVLSADQRTIDLSNDYKGNLDTYQSGRAVRTLTALPEGRQSVRVRAWDTHNNSSTAEVDFEVRTGGEADVFHVVNYPNPFSRSTTFTMQRVSGAAVDVRIRIYTVAGRMIRELEAWSVTDRFVRIPWDGRDTDGNEVANGVYLYKAILKSVESGETREVIEKLAVMR